MASTEDLWVIVPTGQQESGAWIDDTLKVRVTEKGLDRKTFLAAEFPRQRVEVIPGPDADERLNDLYYARGWTDGLPVQAPTIRRVRDALRFTPRKPQDVLGHVEPLKGAATVEKVAANAVMAGCKPEYCPVVLAIVEAVLDPAFNMRGVQTTDENVTPLIILNGPITRQLDINASFGALGPGWRANATLGRALRLVMNNLGGGWPGAVSFAGLGQAGRYTLCIAENEAESPWMPLHAEAGLERATSAATVTRAETVVNVTGGLAEIASVMGSAVSSFGLLWSGKPTVILSPALAIELHSRGLSKNDVRHWLYQHGRWLTDAWQSSYLYTKIITQQQWPDWARAAAATGRVPVVRSPADIVLVVAGGNIPIPQHAYCPSWGFPPACITKEIALPSDWEELLAETNNQLRNRLCPTSSTSR